ncbi:MAG: DUF3500 domain-containing protein [Verrucomicrobiaceae bacterium]|nr:DUF3500 domain-containing protein [Verrucomicrobiaceae bacterium]
MKRFFTVFSLVSLAISHAVLAHDPAPQMAEIANAWLTILDDAQKAKATFEFGADERLNWHFIPRSRNGLPLKEMSPQQRLLALALMNSGLSHDGARKALTIMNLEEHLWQTEGAAAKDDAAKAAVRLKRDPEKYYVSIFGTPEVKGTWGWRIEGHHLAMNFTIKDGALLRATPSFFGSNPGEVREGKLKGLRVLHVEEEMGRSLVKSLTAEQFAKAKVADVAPKEMLTAADRWVNPLKPDGLVDSDMNPEQKKMLHALVEEYLRRLRPEIADEALKEISSSGPVYFGWAGELERGQPHYYRVQGKSFLLEYDNVQNGANHVHCVWRSFDGDFGADLLGEHYKAEHQGQPTTN